MNSMYYKLFSLPVIFLCLISCNKQGKPEVPAASPDSARIMLLQPWPLNPPLDLYSVNMDTAKIGTAITYPGISSYVGMPSGTRFLSCMLAGTFATYFSNQVFYFKPGGNYTICFLSGSGVPMEDDLSAPAAGKAKLRMLYACNYVNPTSLTIHGGDTLASGLHYFGPDTATFRELTPGNYLFDLHDDTPPYVFKASLNASLQAGHIYTVYANNLPVDDPNTVRIGMQLILNK